jgi:hypothetical protein
MFFHRWVARPLLPHARMFSQRSPPWEVGIHVCLAYMADVSLLTPLTVPLLPHPDRRSQSRIGGLGDFGDVVWTQGMSQLRAIPCCISAELLACATRYKVPEVPKSPEFSSRGMSVITLTPYRPHNSSIFGRSVRGIT